jgi:hypothetical protein
MRTLIAAIALGGALLPSVAVAEELDLGLFGSVEYDDNLFNSSDEETDDVVLRAGPIIGLGRPQGSLTYDLRYEPRYEAFVDQSGLDDWDHAAFGRVRWQFAPTTALSVVERFNLTHSLNRSTFIGDPVLPDAEPTPEIEVARQELIQNSLSLQLTHNFDERLYGVLTGTHSLFRNERDDRYDSDSYSGTGEMLYTVTSRNRLGGGAAVSFQDIHDIEFDDGRTQEGQDTTYYRIFGSWLYLFDPTFEITLRAGPAFIDSDRVEPGPQLAVVQTYPTRTDDAGQVRFIDSDTCPRDSGVPYLSDRCDVFGTVLPQQFRSGVGGTQSVILLDDDPDDSNFGLTIFAELELVKRWERFRTRFKYARSDSTSSGAGQSSVLDVVLLQLIWDPTPVWTVSLTGSWTLRQQTDPQTSTVVGLAAPELVTAFTVGPGGLETFTTSASRASSLRFAEVEGLGDVMTYQASLRVKRRIGRRTEVFGQLTYLRQDYDQTATRDAFDNFRALLGARWMFDPINVL